MLKFATNSQKLYCPFRSIWVPALPEELVRQALLNRLMNEKGYPIGLIALEKSLSHMPHLQATQHLPSRRADIVIFARDIHPKHALYPLLLIECKAIALKPAMMRQLHGYNYYLQAPFIALANQENVYFSSYQLMDQKGSSLSFFPSYTQLIENYKKIISN